MINKSLITRTTPYHQRILLIIIAFHSAIVLITYSHQTMEKSLSHFGFLMKRVLREIVSSIVSFEMTNIEQSEIDNGLVCV